jgi:molybdenum cofactor cytidylyltransferase
VGAGGKTTALFRAGRELLAGQNDRKASNTILLTTTTHLGAWQTGGADHWYIVDSIGDILSLGNALPEGIVLLTGTQTGDRLSGLSMDLVEGVHQLACERNLPLLIEADGAHMLPLKAPGKDEPVVPPFVDVVVVVAGLTGLGKPLTDAWVQRSELFGKLAGIHSGDMVTSEALVKVLVSQRGGLKNIPEHARNIVLLNQADHPELQSEAHIMAKELIFSYDSVVISALRQPSTKVGYQETKSAENNSSIYSAIEHTAGIILAAGGSNRFGQPKQLLPWKGQPLIRHIIQAAIEAGLQPVVVVLGSSANEINPTIKDLKLRIVINDGWANGISSSIKAGLRALPLKVGAAIFLKADQPQIPSRLIECLVEEHQNNLYSIIAPQIEGQRGNPVLFDAELFPELEKLEGDVGGKALFERYPPSWVKWEDEKLLLDVDTPEDYQKLQLIYPEHEV